jgi:hypothetical protein
MLHMLHEVCHVSGVMQACLKLGALTIPKMSVFKGKRMGGWNTEATLFLAYVGHAGFLPGAAPKS